MEDVQLADAVVTTARAEFVEHPVGDVVSPRAVGVVGV